MPLHSAQLILETSGCGGGIAAGEQQRRHRQRRFSLCRDAFADLRQQLVGVLEPALTDPQGGEPDQGLGVQAWARPVGDPKPDRQLALGVAPPALRGEDAAVVDAAFGVQERAAVGGDEIVGHLAPLRRSFQVVGQLASVEHLAAGVDHGVQRRALPAQRRRDRLVKQRKSARRVTCAHPDVPELGQRSELQIDITDVPGNAESPRGQLLGDVQIGHSVGAGHPQPTVSHPGPERFQQPVRPAEPAVGGREVGEVGLVGDPHPDRDSGRALVIAAPS